nr:IS1595 family transposase [uncultured Albidiferax sp.]
MRKRCVASRWPKGWRCAHCGCSRSFQTRNGTGRQLWECLICGYQSSSTVGTVLKHTKPPLNTWLLAWYLLTQSKNSSSALEPMRQPGVTYKTA